MRSSLALLACLGLLACASAEPHTDDAQAAPVPDLGGLQECAAGTQLCLHKAGGPSLVVGDCDDETAGEIELSQDRVASVLYRNCGASVDFATRVMVRSAASSATVAVLLGRQPVALESAGPDRLLVRLPSGSSEIVFQQDTRWDDVLVEYEEDPSLSIVTSEYVEFASYNFGATGRAAGVPAETLLRIAGWSQAAAGLSRPEWGTWDGAAPYGDDPRGHDQVSNGIQYYEVTSRRGSGVP